MNTQEWFQLVQSVASVATVVLVYFTWKQLSLVRKQAVTGFEDHLTEQYRRIVESIPIDVWLGSELKNLDKGRQELCRDAIFRYLDLCNEEAFLFEKKRVTDETWTEWKDGIRSNLGLPAFNEVWTEVREKSPKTFKELRKLVSS